MIKYKIAKIPIFKVFACWMKTNENSFGELITIQHELPIDDRLISEKNKTKSNGFFSEQHENYIGNKWTLPQWV